MSCYRNKYMRTCKIFIIKIFVYKKYNVKKTDRILELELERRGDVDGFVPTGHRMINYFIHSYCCTCTHIKIHKYLPTH